MKKVMKKVFSLALTAGLIISTAIGVHAETLTGGNWNVSFTADQKLASNFNTSDLNDVVSGMQPGDSAELAVAVTNAGEASTDWYMENKILTSMEDNSHANGGAYAYKLVYSQAGAEDKILYDSETVGGEGSEGLEDAIKSLEGYVYLGTLAGGESGRVVMIVTLDGETQGNGYMSTLAELSLKFAVQLTPQETVVDVIQQNNTTVTKTETGTSTSKTNIVKTGDYNSLLPYIMGACLSGAVLLGFAIFSIVSRREKDEEA